MQSVVGDAIQMIEQQLPNWIWLEMFYILKGVEDETYIGRVYVSSSEGINLRIRDHDGETIEVRKEIADISKALQLAVNCHLAVGFQFFSESLPRCKTLLKPQNGIKVRGIGIPCGFHWG